MADTSKITLGQLKTALTQAKNYTDNEIAEANIIDDTNATAITTYSSNKIENIKANLSSQIKEKVNYSDRNILDLNIFNETARNILMGQEQGHINAVLGKGNVTIDNLSPQLYIEDDNINYSFDNITGHATGSGAYMQAHHYICVGLDNYDNKTVNISFDFELLDIKDLEQIDVALLLGTHESSTEFLDFIPTPMIQQSRTTFIKGQKSSMSATITIPSGTKYLKIYPTFYNLNTNSISYIITNIKLNIPINKDTPIITGGYRLTDASYINVNILNPNKFYSTDIIDKKIEKINSSINSITSITGINFLNDDFGSLTLTTAQYKMFILNTVVPNCTYNKATLQCNGHGNVELFVLNKISDSQFEIVDRIVVECSSGKSTYDISISFKENQYLGVYSKVLAYDKKAPVVENYDGSFYDALYQTSGTVDATMISFNVTFGIYLESNQSVVSRIDKLENEISKTNKYKNLKFNFLGDSITEGYNTDKVYHQYISEELELNTVRNYGIGGSTISNVANGMCQRVNNMDDDADIIFCFGGTNDFQKNVTLGNLYDEANNIISPTSDISTFYGALHTLCQNLIKKYPNKKVILITPIHREVYGSQPTEYQKNNAGLLLSDYVKAIKDVGMFYSIPVCDLYANSGLQPNIAKHKTLYFHSDDGLHPNSEGHKIIASKIISFLNTI